ncbi:MAG TPA: DUF1003 domain-containing protein, partial [Steroidobacteraceae bacterium]|nr:DUF1003 domain-containing protein [Steroidobacteraceae bacterium]
MAADNLDQNIDSVLEVRKRELERRSPTQRFVERISAVMGRPLYLAVLFLFVCGWISYNLLARSWERAAFDPPPFALLDGILSLAALITTTVVLVAQNRLTRIEQQHAHIALQVNLITEQKVTKIINLLEELRRDLPMVKDRFDAQAASFAQKTDAVEVLTAIEEVGLAKGPHES